MMRGISEERLKKIAHDSRGSDGTNMPVLGLLDMLLSECKELNEWKPIDENTPKDRKIMLFYEKCGIHTGEFRCGHYLADANLCVPCNIKPTHWQELPEPPKD